MPRGGPCSNETVLLSSEESSPPCFSFFPPSLPPVAPFLPPPGSTRLEASSLRRGRRNCAATSAFLSRLCRLCPETNGFSTVAHSLGRASASFRHAARIISGIR